MKAFVTALKCKISSNINEHIATLPCEILKRRKDFIGKIQLHQTDTQCASNLLKKNTVKVTFPF